MSLWSKKPEYIVPIMPESEKDGATRLLTEQLKELQTAGGLSHEHPDFKAWHDTTKSYLQRFLPQNSPFTSRFLNLRFHDYAVMAEWRVSDREPIQR